MEHFMAKILQLNYVCIDISEIPDYNLPSTSFFLTPCELKHLCEFSEFSNLYLCTFLLDKTPSLERSVENS